MAQWEATSFEDRLLKAYWDQMGGKIFTEVQIGASGPSEWPEGSKTRRIDAVRILSSEGGKDDILSYNSSRDYFIEIVKGSDVELIEIKRDLNRPVIGQILVGEEMFRKDYDPRKVSLTILCAEEDPALKWVCNEKDINLKVSKQKF